jgi:hypothetical protein
VTSRGHPPSSFGKASTLITDNAGFCQAASRLYTVLHKSAMLHNSVHLASFQFRCILSLLVCTCRQKTAMRKPELGDQCQCLKGSCVCALACLLHICFSQAIRPQRCSIISCAPHALVLPWCGLQGSRCTLARSKLFDGLFQLQRSIAHPPTSVALLKGFSMGVYRIRIHGHSKNTSLYLHI